MYPNLKAEMARNNMTAQRLSDVTGIPYSTLTPKLRGEGSIDIKDAKKIRDAIDDALTLDYLFTTAEEA